MKDLLLLGNQKNAPTYLHWQNKFRAITIKSLRCPFVISRSSLLPFGNGIVFDFWNKEN